MKFRDRLIRLNQYPLTAKGIGVLQINLGNDCNMSCRHCHVNGSHRTGQRMGRDTARAVQKVLCEHDIPVLDLTGGAPELNPCFRDLVAEARKAGRHVIVRTNLTIFFEEGMQDLPEFYRKYSVEIIASLPHFTASPVDRVRGHGVFEKSIEALRMLNCLGYGKGADDGVLNLVYTPPGAFLPPLQETLEKEYRQGLLSDFGISFHRLFTFTNMPIGRFRDFLSGTGNLELYMKRLQDAFNPATVDNIMCRHLISVGWDGRLYCCDFNQALGLGMKEPAQASLSDFDYDRLVHREISTGDHCFGCTAGYGST